MGNIFNPGKAHASHGRAQSLCDWKGSSLTRWKNSASLGAWATKDWGLLR